MSEPGDHEPVIHLAVARHASRRPDARALISGHSEISYGVLDAAANYYAAELAARGVGPGHIVPLLLNRSPLLVALQLGVLKTGAAYANLDPQWPMERQAGILKQVAPVLTVTSQEDWDGNFEIYRPTPDDVRAAAAHGSGFTPVAVAPSAPATVFFTSGSTGVPKGVVSPHQAVTRLFGPGRLSGFGPGHTTPQVAPIPWDMYAFELWGQLTTGGTVVLIAADYLLPSVLREIVRSRHVDTLWLTASLFNLFVDEDVDCFAGLTHVLAGGERLSPKHVREFLLRHKGIALSNGYGPAESCMLTTTRLLSVEDCDNPGGVPIGSALPGTAVMLLNSHDKLCLPGEQGEICIAGQGLAIGYLGQPGLTAEKFPTIEFDGGPVRVYRTGDIGIYDDEGVLHFRGRNDRQIKVSGYRIELAEVELAASLISAARNPIAFPVTGPDEQYTWLALVYLTSGLGGAASGSNEGDPLDVHTHLRRLLPSYMVPGIVRGVSKYPVTANGKVDLEALQSFARHSLSANHPRGARR